MHAGGYDLLKNFHLLLPAEGALLTFVHFFFTFAFKNPLQYLELYMVKQKAWIPIQKKQKQGGAVGLRVVRETLSTYSKIWARHFMYGVSQSQINLRKS